MKDELLRDSITSICIALVVMHVNKISQRLLFADLPLVLRVRICQGPKVSKPTYVKGGPGISLSAGKSAIFWVCSCPRNFLHVTHF